MVQRRVLRHIERSKLDVSETRYLGRFREFLRPDVLAGSLRPRGNVYHADSLIPTEERSLVDQLVRAARGEQELDLDALGRLAEPKLRRALSLIDDPDVREYGTLLVERLSAAR